MSTGTPAIEQILEYPANQATIPGLLDCLRSGPGVIPFVGPELTAGLGIPRWRSFLVELGERAGISRANRVADDELIGHIRKAAGDLFINDAIQVQFGDHRLPTPIQGAIAVVPYLTRDVVITTNLDRALERTFEQAMVPFVHVIWADPELAQHQVLSAGIQRVLIKLRGDAYDPTERSLEQARLRQRLKNHEPVRTLMDAAARFRSLLYIGIDLPTSETSGVVLEFTVPDSQVGYALIPAQQWDNERIRRLYSMHIRPIWHPGDENLLAQFLAYLVGVMNPPPIGIPPRDVLNGTRYNVQVPNPTPAEKSSGPDLPPIEVPEELLVACQKGECVAFIGSGLSARAGLPTWQRFVEGLVLEARRLGCIDDVSAESQLAALHDGEVNAVADNVVNTFGNRRAELLEYYQQQSQSSEELPWCFELLTQLPFAGVLTSNYDDLLERAYAGKGLQRELTPHDSEQLLELLSSKTPFLLKAYGNLNRPDSIVLAPADYLNLVRSNAAFARFMEGLFFSRTLLFLGTSLDGLSDYLAAFSFPSGVPRKHFALVAVEGVSWRAKAELLHRRYNIRVIPFPKGGQFAEVDEFLEELVEKTRPKPQPVTAVTATPSKPRLQKVVLRNIGPFRELELAFEENWRILLGDNGVGKSTILKAIAVAIVGSEARHDAGRLLRAGQSLGSITLTTARNPSGYVAEIQRVGSSAEVVSHSGRALEAEGWVALGFPPLRTGTWNAVSGPQGMGVKRPSADDVLPLIAGDTDPRLDDLKQWLVNTDALSRNESASDMDRLRATEVRDKFNQIVGQLTEGVVASFKEVTSDYRVMFETRDGVVPIESLSQGITSLLSWVGILLQRLYEVHFGNSQVTDPTQEYALVLMDEIDAHMHPKWQQVLVERLKRIFPNTQIIASTHSPLVVGGLKVSEVVRFVRDGAGDVVMAPLDQEMLFGRPDQLLTGGLFDLDTWLDATTREVTERYRKLLGTTHRTEEQEREFQKLRRIVRVRVPMSPTTPPERLAQEIIHTVLKEQVGDEFPNAVQDVQARVSQLLDEVQKQQSQNRA